LKEIIHFNHKTNIFSFAKITDISSESSPIVRKEFGKHMARDLRPFPHTESLQILQILRSTLVDSPLLLIPHAFYGV
jgi:hypothetical protein